jgi:hypothetical protein
MDQETPVPMADPKSEAARRRRGRSWAILFVLLGLCALFYAITIVKMAHF